MDGSLDDAGTVVVRVPYAGLSAVARDVRGLLLGGRDVVLELAPPGAVDLALVDLLARLRLAARRSGAGLHVRADGVAGLADLAGLRATLLGQGERQAEPDEQLLAQEVVDVRDPAP